MKKITLLAAFVTIVCYSRRTGYGPGSGPRR